MFAVEIECRADELAGLRTALDEWLSRQQVAGHTAFHVKLVTHEAAKNAIEHSDPCEHVAICAELAEGEIVVQVADTNVEPWELRPATDDQLRGLTLIELLARRVRVVPLQPHGTALVAAVPRA